MGLELETPRELRETAIPHLTGSWTALALPTGPVLPSCPAGHGHSFLHTATLPPLRHLQSSAHLSHSGVGVTNLAQICLSTQEGGQLGLGQQVLQVVGSSDFQLGQGQADGPVEIMPLVGPRNSQPLTEETEKALCQPGWCSYILG